MIIKDENQPKIEPNPKKESAFVGMPPKKLPPPPPPNIFAKSKAPCIGPPAPFGIKLFIMPEKPPPPPNWLSTDPMLLGVQLILRLPCGMQALTSDEAAVPMASPIFMPVIAP